MESPRIVVMGVSGSGKTSVGVELAARLGLPYAEGDDLHPWRNVEKMAAGRPLTDADREPWLRAVAAWLGAHDQQGGVVTCSALRRRYRDLLRGAAPDLVFLHLSAPRQLLEARLEERAGHFMPASLLASQLATLEPLAADERGTTVDVSAPVEEVVDRFLAWLGAR